jgi:hypothetical protein
MSAFARRMIALGIACGVAFGVVYLMDHLAAGATPRPSGVHESIKVALEAGQIPFNALLLVLGGWLVAAYLGSTIASRLSGERGTAQIFAVVFTLAILVTQLQATHPVWMWLGGLLGAPLIALGAAGESITVRTSR